MTNLRSILTNIEQENVQLKQSIENLESINEELKSKLNIFDNEKQTMEEEINNYRQQLENLQSHQNQEQTIEKERISITQNDDYEEYKLNIQRQDHSGLDTLFEQLYALKNQTNDSNNWQISLSKSNDQVF